MRTLAALVTGYTQCGHGLCLRPAKHVVSSWAEHPAAPGAQIEARVCGRHLLDTVEVFAATYGKAIAVVDTDTGAVIHIEGQRLNEAPHG